MYGYPPCSTANQSRCGAPGPPARTSDTRWPGCKPGWWRDAGPRLVLDPDRGHAGHVPAGRPRAVPPRPHTHPSGHPDTAAGDAAGRGLAPGPRVAEPEDGAAQPSPTFNPKPQPSGRGRLCGRGSGALRRRPYTLEAGHEAEVWVLTESGAGARIGTVRRAYGPRGPPGKR